MVLPVAVGPLIGRHSEVEDIVRLLASGETRLVTLTGPGGVGKTRLAIGALEVLAPHFPDGVAFVDLSSLLDPGLVIPVIATALDVREVHGETIVESVARTLAGQRRLVVVDNFEQVLRATPDVGAMLVAAPGLHVLATSREPLGLLLEQEYPVPPLALPRAEDLQGDLAQLAAVPSVELFLRRARAVRPDFAVTTMNGPAVADIVRRLDGLPLAIELAAARLRALTPEALTARLQDRLDLLESREHDRPGRHRTLRAAIAWSFELLNDDERRLFCVLGAFAGSSSLDAIEAVCAEVWPDAGADVLGLIESLVEKGLLVREPEAVSSAAGTEPRFRLLETIRVFAQEQLDGSGDAPRVRRAHAEYYLALAEEAEPGLIGSDQARWFAALSLEWANLDAALTWALQNDEVGFALRIAGSLSFYWWRRGQLDEGRRWLGRVLQAPHVIESSDSAPYQLKALLSAGFLAGLAGDVEAADTLLAQGADLARAMGSDPALAQALGFRAWIAWLHARYEWTPDILAGLESVRTATGSFGLGFLLVGVGYLLEGQGDDEGAARCWEEALPGLIELQEAPGVALSNGCLGLLALKRGEIEQARAWAREGLRALHASADPQAMANLGDAVVEIEAASPARDRAHLEQRARLVGAVDHIRDGIRIPRAVAQWPAWSTLSASLRADLGDESFEAAYASGSTLSSAETIDEVLKLLEQPIVASPGPIEVSATATATQLTAREREIAALIGRGLTSKEIADTLVISERTADTHAAHIREKLGLRSRAEIAAWAARHDIAPPD